MKPLFTVKNLRLFHGGAVEVMSRLPASSFDMIFADPPYNLSNGGFTCHAGRRVSVNKGKWDKSRGLEADFAFNHEWIHACRRALKPNGTLWISGTYHSIYSCGFALMQDGWHILNDICWFKPNAAPNLSCRMFTASHETLLWARKDKKARHVFNYETMRDSAWPQDGIKKPHKQMRSVWEINTPPPSEKRFGKHPTQKPLALLERIVLASTEKGALVLDPFCGSGTTGIAALMYGRQFVGIDKDKDYLRWLAMPRLKEIGAFVFVFASDAQSRRTQYEQVASALRRLGGEASLRQLYKEKGLRGDMAAWRTKTPLASVRRIVQKAKTIKKVKPGFWRYQDSVV